MDFYRIRERVTKAGMIEVYPDFQVIRSTDLMVRAKSFNAVWNEELGLWVTDEYEVRRMVDRHIREYVEERYKGSHNVYPMCMNDFSTGVWRTFRQWLSQISDNSHQLDSKLTFANTEVRKEDYVSKRLPYSLEEGDISAYDTLISTLYDPAEREKIEWAIGAIISGDSKTIQKFLVFYGEAGAGKSTILNLIQKLFEGYTASFEAKALASNNNAFATEAFSQNPLVAIQHDGDLSRIEDNSKLNSIISHEDMTINEKYKPAYTSRINAFLLMATNRPVKITDAKSGIIRRLIDVNPSGRRLPPSDYFALVAEMDQELGAIAYHCLQVYLSLGKNYYNGYRPVSMMFKTDTFYNFVEAHYYDFVDEGGITLARAYDLYKVYCDDSSIDRKLPRHAFREELKNYFAEYHDRLQVGGERLRGYYVGFLKDKFESEELAPAPEHPYSLVLEETESRLDDIFEDCPAQLSNENGHPPLLWAPNEEHPEWKVCDTRLKEIDTKLEHFVRPPAQHIVIDFDITDLDGNKDMKANLEAASKWPPTYAEYSKSGGGVHLHYIYDGDTTRLKSLYAPGIEIKAFHGLASLRRRLSFCNNLPIAHISEGLPLKEEKVIDTHRLKSEQSLRDLIIRNLKKEIHPGTKPSIDFIKKILDDAYSQGLEYDVRDMRGRVLAFAMNSTNQSSLCVKLVSQMKFKSDHDEPESEIQDGPLVVFDVEVFPNLFIVCWKKIGEDTNVVRMINPSPEDIERLCRMNLVGFNNRRYDNHILYGRYLGLDNQQLFELSKKIVNSYIDAGYMAAYSLSYTDIYDFAATKQSLKKWQVELGLNHKECELPWDEPVPEDRWDEVADYCVNDVVSTEKVFLHLEADYNARLVLAKISGLTPNDSTQKHIARILFGKDRDPQSKFVYTDLSETFPGYAYDAGKSLYRGEDPSEGGYVYAEPGVHYNVALLDVASMHPTSIEELTLFGPYTKNYSDIKKARIAIKHGDLNAAREMLGGALAPYIGDKEENDKLSYALKIILNTVYGLTSASFDNPFRDRRNVDNIVAKRGALFMIDLKHFVQEKGFTVAHIKTDSIKIVDATPEIIDEVSKFGARYGYEFEHEATYDKFCLLNDAVYIAHDEKGWHATGAQTSHPYVFKTLFSKEPIEPKDYFETKQVQGATIYLDMNHGLPEGEHNYKFIGKVGQFVPTQLTNKLGGPLLREKDGKYTNVVGTKGYHWIEVEVLKAIGKMDDIDPAYHQDLVRKLQDQISELDGGPEFLKGLLEYVA